MTNEKPTAVLPYLPQTNGAIGTTFFASASTYCDGDFQYYFIVSDKFCYQCCVHGCQGVQVARFQFASTGKYSLRCDVYDSLGYTLLTGANKTVSITVSPPSPALNLQQMAKMADDSFLAGDHSLYQQYANDMVKLILDRSNQTSTNSTFDSKIVRNITRKIGQVTANSVPNPIESTSYVRTAASIAKLTPEQGIVFDMPSILYAREHHFQCDC